MTAKRKRHLAARDLPPSQADSAAPATTASSRVPGLREEQGRLLATVHVTPRAGRDELTLDGGVLRARLAAAPVEGAANAALVALLAARLRLPKRAVTLVRGATSREKVVALDGLTADELRQRLS